MKDNEWQQHVPCPVLDGGTDLIELYWKAWELAHDHVKEDEGLPQSPYLDEALWEDTIWIWDTCFMALYSKYAPKAFPGIESLNNFYVPLHTNRYAPGTFPLNIQHPDNPPLFAWVEHDNFRFTNDTEHIGRLLNEAQYLQKHFEWFDRIPLDFRFASQADTHNPSTPIALQKRPNGYLWGGVQSGMDNSPRGRVFGLADTLWVDALAQQGLAALYIARLARAIGDESTGKEYQRHYEQMKDTVNDLYWDPEDNAYYDIHRESEPGAVRHSKILTPASFWPLMAEMASPEQAQSMMDHLQNEKKLGGTVPFVTLSRDDQDFDADTGDYWRGAIWLPTSYMGIKSLEKYGHLAEADSLAERTVEHMLKTYQNPAAHELNNGKPTIWECYNPGRPLPSTNHGRTVRPDFCGWSALGPISLLIENILGFHVVDAVEKRIEWRLHQRGRHGVKNLRFGNIETNIIYDGENTVTVQCNEPFALVINDLPHSMNAGANTIVINPTEDK